MIFNDYLYIFISYFNTISAGEESPKSLSIGKVDKAKTNRCTCMQCHPESLKHIFAYASYLSRAARVLVTWRLHLFAQLLRLRVFMKCMPCRHKCSSMSYAAMHKHAWITVQLLYYCFLSFSLLYRSHIQNRVGFYTRRSDCAIFFAMRSGDRSVTVLAYELHQSVPADRWCVTYWDLTFLRQEVKTALGCGQIQPEPDVPEAYGPSIYTVTEQYIKPVTRQAGKMSWALMRNPQGLQCDLFISHAWQEGVFEFLGKVRNSWPRGVKTAWCCMLANPQNLDISSFLQSPTTSPFAIALRAADVMLVVPNRQQSVYTRLWFLVGRIWRYHVVNVVPRFLQDTVYSKYLVNDWITTD